jgi:hypothetical protein
MSHPRSFGHRRIAALAVLTCLSAAAASAGPSPHMQFDFGMVGLARGQTVRLNVVITASPPADLGRRQASDPEWLVELSFVGSSGETLVPAVQHRLVPGQAAFVDLNFTDVPSSNDDRVQVRAVVRAHAVRRRGVGGIDDPNILPSLELMDAETSRTQVFLAPGSTRFIKEVDPAPQP